MRMLEVRQPGPAMTVQDLGRHGYQRFGVAEGGAVDRGAHILGAVLLDQAPDTASIEMAAAAITDLGHDNALLCAKAIGATACELLQDPSLVARARAEFEQRGEALS